MGTNIPDASQTYSEPRKENISTGLGFLQEPYLDFNEEGAEFSAKVEPNMLEMLFHSLDPYKALKYVPMMKGVKSASYNGKVGSGRDEVEIRLTYGNRNTETIIDPEIARDLAHPVFLARGMSGETPAYGREEDKSKWEKILAVAGAALVIGGVGAAYLLQKEDQVSGTQKGGERNDKAVKQPENQSISESPNQTVEQIKGNTSNQTNLSQKSPEEENKTPVDKAMEEEYPDASKGGEYGPGDKVSYMGVEGEISSGKIVDGELKSGFVTIYKDDKFVFGHTRYSEDKPVVKNSPYEQVELIEYPQRGYVRLKINGTDTGYEVKMYDGGTLEGYLDIVTHPDKFSKYILND